MRSAYSFHLVLHINPIHNHLLVHPKFQQRLKHLVLADKNNHKYGKDDFPTAYLHNSFPYKTDLDYPNDQIHSNLPFLNSYAYHDIKVSIKIQYKHYIHLLIISACEKNTFLDSYTLQNGLRINATRIA